MADDAVIGCPVPGATGDRAVDLRRQARLVDDLFERLAAIRMSLPREGDVEGWRGPAAGLFLDVVAEHDVQLGREITRLDGVRGQLRGAAALAEAEAVARGGMP